MGNHLPFIPSKMDDAGLTPAQFRIVSRVSRRGECYESIKNMAKGCRLAVTTVKTALRFLVSRNVFSKEKRAGETSIYRVKAANEWRTEPDPNDCPAQTATQVAEPSAPRPKCHPDHLDQKTSRNGHPNKCIPVESGPHNLENCDAGLLAKDRERLQRHIQEARDAPKPDKELISGLQAGLRLYNDEFRRRGRIAGSKQANEADTASHQPARETFTPHVDETPSTLTQPTPPPKQAKSLNYWKLSQEEQARLKKPLQDLVQQSKLSQPNA
jgi:hypothetical protein